MKRLELEFEREASWRWVWGALCVAAVPAVTAVVFVADGAREVAAKIGRVDAEITLMNAQLAARRMEQAQSEHERALRTILWKLQGFDLDKVFDAVEKVDEPGAALQALRLDLSGNSVEATYDLLGLDDAVSVNYMLNLGLHAQPWRLRDITPAEGRDAGRAARFRAQWSAVPERL